MQGFLRTKRHRQLSTRPTATLVAVLLLLAAAFAPTSFAAAPNPTLGSADVDGSTSDWSLSGDFFSDMSDAGRPEAPVRAKLYLRYDCDTEVLYALVLALNGEKGRQTRVDEAYIRINGTGKLMSATYGDDGTPPDFAWVNGDGTLADGWEGSGPLAPGSYSLRAHMLVADNSADGYTPMDVIGREAPLVIDCPVATPEPTPTPVVTPTPTGSVPTPTGSVPTPTGTVPTPTGTVPTPTPDVTPTPTPTGTNNPTEQPNVTPTGGVDPTEQPNSTPDGGVGGATGTPNITLPPTDTLSSSVDSNQGSDGIRLAFLLLAALVATLAFVTPARALHRIRRG